MRTQTERNLQINTAEKNSIKYLLYLPDDDENSENHWPLILFLHGAGERGDDLSRVKSHGPPRLVNEGRSLPFIIVSPQCPENQRWEPEKLKLLLDEIITNYRVDQRRIYLTGLSMGGFGTWAMAAEYPNQFAAIAPVCGGGNPAFAKKLSRIPAWVFHGAKDDLVPIKKSEEMVNALKREDGNVRFTVYPEAGHDSWTETYNNQELYNWLLKYRLK